MQQESESLTIGRLAQAASVNVETIRYYQRRGLLAEPKRQQGRIRRYGSCDLDRLSFIKTAQRLGFSLNEVAELLLLEDGTHCEEASRLAAAKLTDVQQKLAELRRMELVLEGLVQRCRTSSDDAECPLIESLHRGLDERIV